MLDISSVQSFNYKFNILLLLVIHINNTC